MVDLTAEACANYEVMPSVCVFLRRGFLRRYRQVPRTEADGAFNYGRTSNRRGLLDPGRLDVTSDQCASYFEI